jgi:hypothetical protein
LKGPPQLRDPHAHALLVPRRRPCGGCQLSGSEGRTCAADALTLLVRAV